FVWIFILISAQVAVFANENSVSTHAELVAALEKNNNAGIFIRFANNITLENEQTYDFTGVTFDVNGGVMLVPADSMVTIVGFNHARADGTLRNDWGTADFSRYVKGVEKSSWVYRPDFADDDKVRWWDTDGSFHWCRINAHNSLSPPIPVATEEILVASIEADRRGGLKDVRGNIVDNSIRIILNGEIFLENEKKYNFADVTILKTNGNLIIPADAEIFGLENCCNEMQLFIGKTSYTLNGFTRHGTVAPFISGGRTMVPLRVVAEGLGADVNWNAPTETAIITHNGKEIRLTANRALPDGMGTPVIENGRTFVPVRFVAENFGAEIDWDGAAQTVSIQLLCERKCASR
ncbi:MAG: copper amine oxidase N-terminal domain-containing protein, partial [Defluviitaleaceae bacterium]|nr:copper amine oxidase N-terminal domain-containing protein [Defluviitaleaceae bacterium]